MSELTLDQAAKAAASRAPRAQAPRLIIRKAAVLGAGVMGAQIAAHLANANVEPLLFELAAEGKDKSANVEKAIDGLAKLNPSPLASAAVARQIVPANYDEHLHLLADCDLVIEAIAERMDWKQDAVREGRRRTWPRTRSSRRTPRGCRSRSLSGALPAALRARFCGIHFFNPPRYMRLVELDADRPTPTRRSSTSSRRSSRPRSARAWCAPRTRPTSWPTASASSRCSRPCTTRPRSAWASTRSTRSPARRSAAARAPPTAPPTWWAWTPWPTW